MKIHDILNERKIQRTAVMYHGTSSALLPSILKHGLLANPPKTTYSRDTSVDEIGYDSFGGVYLTKDRSIADDGAEVATTAHGGEPIVVTVQYVLGSVTTDEDLIVRILVDSLSGSWSTKSKTKSKFGVDLRNYFSQKDKAEWEIQNVIEHFIDTAKSGNIKLSRQAVDAIRNLTIVVINHIIEKFDYDDKNKSWPDSYLKYQMLNELRPTSEFDTAMRKVLIAVKPIKTDTIRITRNIGFRGKNRILRIERAYGHKVYYDQGKIQKGAAPKIVKAEWYFFGNPNDNYAWGVGQTPDEALKDAKKAFDEWVVSNAEDSYSWEEELEVAKLYPTDKRTADLILNDGYRKFVKKNNLMVADSTET